MTDAQGAHHGPAARTSPPHSHATPEVDSGHEPGPWRVAAVIPGFGRHDDLNALFRDLSRLDLRPVRGRPIQLWVVLMDNASPKPLAESVVIPPNVRGEIHRLPENTGGAGGFSRGMARILAGEGLSSQFDPPHFVWLLDSDVRVARKSLRALLRVLVRRDDVCAAGSALVDTRTGVCYEIGGRLEPVNGFFRPVKMGDVRRDAVVSCEYLAACSALVRRDAIEQTGLMPEIFIHGDDVEFFLQMRRATGKKIVAVAASRAGHPVWNRKFQTWVRYYTTRNAYAPIDVRGAEARAKGKRGWAAVTRFRRALVDTLRATGQTITGMDILAELHLRGLEDAAQGRTVGHQIPGGMGPVMQACKPRAYAELPGLVREELARSGPGSRVTIHPLLHLRSKDIPGLPQAIAELGLPAPRASERRYWNTRSFGSHVRTDMIKAAWRALVSSPASVAIVPTGQPTSWFRGRTLILVTNDGFLVRQVRTGDRIRKAMGVVWRGLRASLACARRTPTWHELPKPPARRTPLPSRQSVAGVPGAVVEPKDAPSSSGDSSIAADPLRLMPSV